MKKNLLLATLSVFVLCSCNQEQDDLAKAQDCLDKVPMSSPSDADACMQYVEKYDSQQASILKCGILMTSGGLVESKIVTAYQALKNTTSNKEAVYMATLSLVDGSGVPQLTKATTANGYCQASGVPRLMFLGNAIYIGTSMNKSFYDLTGSGIDLNNPTANINQLLTDCTTGTSNSCTDKLAGLGEATVTLAANYCDSSSADQDVCSVFNGAVTAAGNDTTKVGQALICYLKDLHYNGTSCY